MDQFPHYECQDQTQEPTRIDRPHSRPYDYSGGIPYRAAAEGESREKPNVSSVPTTVGHLERHVLSIKFCQYHQTEAAGLVD